MKSWRVPYPKFGAGLGLHRVQAIAAAMEINLASFGAEAAVITGSNGKGSTGAMLASILRQQGAPVGLFSSPHLLCLNERFQIDGEEITDDDLQFHWSRVQAAIKTWGAGREEEFGGFEFLFLVGASWFKTRRCAFTVWEAGIGGRYDPVRLIRAQRTALTSLDFEHTALLGETLELIAFDKLDAAPAGARVFLGETCQALRDRILSYCALREVRPTFLSSADLGAFAPPLAGPHQRNNAALAAALSRDMASSLSDIVIAAGLQATRWPGRLEIIGQDPLVVVDVGHTPEAIRLALMGFEAMRGPKPGVLVCGASHDKNAASMIGALAPAFDRIICVTPHHKGRPAAEIAAAAGSAHPGAEIIIAEGVADARTLALAKAGSGGAVYCAGGLFLAAEFKAADLGLDPTKLYFF